MQDLRNIFIITKSDLAKKILTTPQILSKYQYALAVYLRSYFFSNSPVAWRFTKVVLPALQITSKYLEIILSSIVKRWCHSRLWHVPIKTSILNTKAEPSNRSLYNMLSSKWRVLTFISIVHYYKNLVGWKPSIITECYIIRTAIGISFNGIMKISITI